MLYVVCAYMIICISALLVFPSYTPEEIKNKKKIDNDKKKEENIDEIVKEFLKDIE